MWIIRLIGAALIVASSALIGFLKGNTLAERYKKLSAIYDGVNTLYEYVERGGCELEKAVKNSFLSVKFLQFKDNVFSCDDKSLTKEDNELLNSFISTLGLSVKKTECDKINNFKIKLKTHINDAKTNYAQKGKIYQSFGICIGLVLAVLLV